MPFGECRCPWDTRFGPQCKANLSMEQGPLPSNPPEGLPLKWWGNGGSLLPTPCPSPSLSLQGRYRSLGTQRGSEGLLGLKSLRRQKCRTT